MSGGTVSQELFQSDAAVERVKGVVFRYVLLAGTLFGIVMLGILLAYILNDAFGLTTASPEWYGLMVVTVGLPTLVLTGIGLKRPEFGQAALDTSGAVIAGLGVGAFLVIVFIIVGPYRWLAYFLTTLVPPTLVFMYGKRIRSPLIIGIGTLVTFLGGLVVGVLNLSFIADTFYILLEWVVYLLSLVLPLCLGLVWLGRTADDRLYTGLAGVVLLGSGVVVGLEQTVLSGTQGSLLLFTVGFLLPVGYTVGIKLRATSGRLGVVAPAILGAGLIGGLLVAESLGLGGPNVWLDWGFLTSTSSRHPAEAGLYPAIIGSVFMIIVMGIIIFPLSVGAAIYLEEYAPNNWFTALIRININNLAGVPSIVYGLLGLAIFVRLLQIGIGVVLVAALTVGLLIMPIVVISAREAIGAVPDSRRQAAFGMGASRWQVTRDVVLPEALPGILTGTILALGRAIGETAPLIMIGAATTVFDAPTSLFDSVSAMPMQIFAWAGSAIPEFRYGVVAAGSATLLVVMLAMNGAAIVLRNKFQQNS